MELRQDSEAYSIQISQIQSKITLHTKNYENLNLHRKRQHLHILDDIDDGIIRLRLYSSYYNNAP